MDETIRVFPFNKLKHAKYLILEIMMHVDYKESWKFMFSLNKASRVFIENNASTIYKGFNNDGLIYYEF